MMTTKVAEKAERLRDLTHELEALLDDEPKVVKTAEPKLRQKEKAESPT